MIHSLQASSSSDHRGLLHESRSTLFLESGLRFKLNTRGDRPTNGGLVFFSARYRLIKLYLTARLVSLSAFILFECLYLSVSIVLVRRTQEATKE